MSSRELGRVEVLARVQSQQVRLVDAGVLLRLSYRQAKRLWKRYGEEGAGGLKHRSAGRRSNRAYPDKFRRQVLRQVREKYGGPVGERFGPTLAAEHLGSGGRAQTRRRDAATLDACSGVVEPRAAATAAPTPEGAQGALWGDGTDGRELPRLAGGAGPEGLPDGLGR